MSYGTGGGPGYGDAYPPQPHGRPSHPQPPQPQPHLPWYRRTAWIVVLLILFAPVGIFLMVKFTSWLKPVKIGAGVAAGVLFLAVAAGSTGDSKEDKDADKVTPAATSSAVPTAPATTAAPATSAPPPTAAPTTEPPPTTAAPVEAPPAAPTPEAVTVPDPPKADPPKRDTPKADPPKADPPKADPPKQDPLPKDPPPKDPPPKDPEKPATGAVHPGAFCTPEGATGATVKGTAMVCSKKAGDPRARWRAA